MQSRGHYKKQKPPKNITLRKGSKNVALPRAFADAILRNNFAWEYYDWLSDTWIPDEHFYSTLASIKNLSADGKSIEQDLEEITYNMNASDPRCVRESWWGGNCEGESIRSICNFGVNDLKEVRQSEKADGANRTTSKCFFANKFSLEVDPMAPLCQYVHMLSVS